MQAEGALSTVELWKSGFGDDYTRRNTAATLLSRQRVWEMVLPIGCQSVLEVGANTGLNLEAIECFSEAEAYACEPNDIARSILESTGVARHITSDTADKIGFPDKHVDLVFTSGVLIHIPTDKLEKSMREIHRVAKRWIIAAEYFAPQEEMVPYRGHANALWRRDYGSLYLDMFPDLTCIGHLFAWKRATGLDNLTFWVFEKGPKRH
jgi:pseudaminic acid biosynthesis-associated methylase